MALRRSSLVLLALAGMACSKAPAEPEPEHDKVEATVVAPLVWDAPGTWTKLDAPRKGPKKAVYRVVKVGNDKEEAELEVYFFGVGQKSDPEVVFKEWFGQFDGDVSKEAKRDKFNAKSGLAAETIEVNGTYKVSLGPALKNKRSPMQMVKKDFRLVGGVVRAADRGNWYFKLVGPDESVQAARAQVRGLLESAR